jgi:hypothetical protein
MPDVLSSPSTLDAPPREAAVTSLPESAVTSSREASATSQREVPDASLQKPDPSRCPLCGAGNGCAMVRQRATGQPQPPCWCTQATFAPELLARVPEAAQRKACICAACAAGASLD